MVLKLWDDIVRVRVSEWWGSFAGGDHHAGRMKVAVMDDERDVTVVLDLEVGYVVQLCQRTTVRFRGPELKTHKA